MRKIILLLFVLGFLSLNAQNSADKFTSGFSDQPRDPRVDHMNYVPNEVIVKFKDEIPLSSAVQLRSAGLSGVDKVLQASGVDSLVRLFPSTKGSLLRSTSVPRVVKDPQGRDMVIPNLDKIYKITIPQLRSTSSTPMNIYQVIEDLKALPEIEYAEPNYIYSVDDLKPIGPELTASDIKKLQRDSKAPPVGIVPNDPLYPQQWYIPAVKADLVWAQTTGDTTQVIGILDTGVDWNHPDLKNKIWRNPGEIPGNGVDDDGNGLIDDIRGWDYINNDNNPMDDNSHGTHVAGIAAAETNNGIGIAGVNWNARIMPLKVFQSSGRGDAASIAKAIIYATKKGATVINMSFGSYARSIAMEDALANAYATSILVAAAGNDGYPLEGCKPDHPFFPACLSFVLGVESPEAKFSNFDCNGPVFSNTNDLLNYEIKAPGSNIISTIPNGNYRIFQGTSMAAPIVSGSVSLYISRQIVESQELMWGSLINSIGTYFDINSAINADPKPVLSIVKYQMADTLSGDDWDYKTDAGETILLNVTVRNSWGQADSVYVGVRFHEFEDTSTAFIDNQTALIGALGSYASLSNSNNQLKIKIRPNVAHDRDIMFVLQTWKGVNKEYLTEQNINIRVEHGTELKGVLIDTLRLTPDKFWLVGNSFKIGPTGVLILEKGTQLKIEKKITNLGQIISRGEKDSEVIISGPEIFWGYEGSVNFNYTTFNNCIFSWDNSFEGSTGNFNNCVFEDIYGYWWIFNHTTFCFNDCVFRSLFSGTNMFSDGVNHFNRCVFYDVYSSAELYVGAYEYSFRNTIINATSAANIYHLTSTKSVVDSCSFLNNNVAFKAPIGITYDLPRNYWGTTDSLKIQNKIFDFWDESKLSLLKIDPQLEKPSAKSHACVWKVVVNDKDTQDEFNSLDPLGAAIHKFQVYFNRPMDIKYYPSVTMGVREPFNQLMINENGSWSDDSLVYTVYKTLGITVSNGLNRIKVVNGKDMEGFDLIPESERFNVNIQTCTSASLEFMATPGLGKVKLEWNNNDLADGLGFNMYRMEHVSDSTLTEPVIINASLINDTLYTDYSVVPNKKYYYSYKVVRTDLSETDPSKVVSAVPFTASKGDANGDLSVNVLDITTIVSYLLNNNPQPFINEAADMNSDGNINVLDIVGVVNNVLYGGLRSFNSVEDQQVRLYVENDTLFADATSAIGGMQFDLVGATSIDDIKVLNALQSFESGYGQRDNTTLRLLFYSISGKSVAAGSRIPLLKLIKNCNLSEVVVSDISGASVPVSLSNPSIGNTNIEGRIIAELGQNFPNPSNGQTNIPVHFFDNVETAKLCIFNMLGQMVKVVEMKNVVSGKHELKIDLPEAKGMYVYKLEIGFGSQIFATPLKKMIFF